ncbi:MAG: DUF1552 domain-containing protein, partial [Planctomycetaceae bacterium]
AARSCGDKLLKLLVKSHHMHRPVPRRTALKAAGVTVALPLLESMNRSIAHEPDQPPKRMVLVCTALGLHPPSLFPKTTGTDYDTTEYLSLLKDHRKDFTLFSGLSHPDQSGKEPHDTEMTFLTAARNPGLGGFRNSISVDQVAANKIGRETRFSSIQLGTNTQESQSYNRNGVMLPAWTRPSQVFARLFLAGTPAEVKRQRTQLATGRSILDAVAQQTKSLNRKASSTDRNQLDEYFSAIRQAESELTAAESWIDRPKPKVDIKPPTDIVDSTQLTDRIRAMLNLIPLILQTDSTRVVTVMIQDHLAVPKINGVSAEHHNLSHHGQDSTKIAQLKIIETEFLKCFNGLLSGLSKRTETSTRLLDSTSVLFGSNLGNANAHDPTNLPIILAGGGYKHGRYTALDSKSNTPLCNLFVNLLNRMGVESDHFGTSTSMLDL